MVVLMSAGVRSLAAVTILTAVVAASGPRQAASEADDVQVVNVRAERFAFTPSEIRVKAGMPVEFRLRSDDTMHGFRIRGLDVNVEIPKRGRGAVVVRVDLQPGRYEFECSQLCGAGHDFMRGAIIVSK